MLQFDGSSDFATIPHFLNPADPEWTYILVFRSDKAASAPANIYVIKSQDNGFNPRVWLTHDLNQRLGCFLTTNSEGEFTGSISTGVWYMAILRRSASAGTFKIQLRRTGYLSTNTVNNPTMQSISGPSTHFLGKSYDFPFFWQGRIAFAASYNRALSDSEATQMFDGAKEYLAPRGVTL